MPKASKEFGVSSSTMRGVGSSSQRQGQLNLGEGGYTPQGAMSLAEEIAVLRKQNKELTKANKRLQEENEFLAEASALAISLDTNMKATLAKSTLDKAYMAYPGLKGAIIHSDRVQVSYTAKPSKNMGLSRV